VSYTNPREVCAPWLTPEQMCCAGDQDVTNCDDTTTALTFVWSDDDLILAASNILYARTCYRYPGECEEKAWPCMPCNCHCHPCACGTWSKIDLPTDYPLLDVTSVTIDGVDFTDFRVDNGKWLVRTDGQRWPSCNNFDLPNNSTPEIVVEYTTGRNPPQELKMAAAELACELKRACEGSASCSLPSNVKSVARRGVAFDLRNVTDLLSEGLTGNPIIDHALKVHGNCSQHGKLFDPAHNKFRGYGTSDVVGP